MSKLDEFYTLYYGEAKTPDQQVWKALLADIVSKWDVFEYAEPLPDPDEPAIKILYRCALKKTKIGSGWPITKHVDVYRDGTVKCKKHDGTAQTQTPNYLTPKYCDNMVKDGKWEILAETKRYVTSNPEGFKDGIKFVEVFDDPANPDDFQAIVHYKDGRTDTFVNVWAYKDKGRAAEQIREWIKNGSWIASIICVRLPVEK